ncbi:MAG: DUF5682 family protein [Hyphomicrobium sp.]|nr:hypothetical protein [Hyphomicrobium sp.]
MLKHTDRLHLFGIRHHGPGSARGVLAALEVADPEVVLIEGPPDADNMIPFAASPAMRPPVALLVHADEDPSNASFYPLAEFSPEWQAMRWALSRGRPVRFIDLPSAIRLGERARLAAGAAARAGGDGQASADDAAPPGVAASNPVELSRIHRDPLAYLAGIAGYDDSEAWWNALVEQGAHGPEIFSSLESAITELRAAIDPTSLWCAEEIRIESSREAHMRLAIADALTATGGQVAVVCGAWHVPALRQKVPAKDDRAVLKGLAKIKVTATWVPWTETRLATGSGYGAGVASPGWYAHLWDELQRHRSGGDTLAANAFTSRWQGRVAALLRKSGRPASTASIIEAARLALSLAALRDLALPGIEEMREASLATLCDGEAAPLKLIEQELITGRGVGEIDGGVPQMPLAADLARWQKKLKLKPEALDSDISLDLRSDAGLAKSQLLHRLSLINVRWGKMQGSGSSRGTFRENWRMRWEPEYSVCLAEALVFGTTVEQAAGNAAIAAAVKEPSLAGISALVRGCLDAGLEKAAEATIATLQRQASQSSDVAALGGAIPPLAGILRYGTAREMPVAPLRLLVTSLVEAVCAGLVYACRSLQAGEAGDMRLRLTDLNVAMGLIDDDKLSSDWLHALSCVAGDQSVHPLLAGFAVRALYDQGALSQDVTASHLSRALSPSVPPLAAGDWIDGFLGTSGQILLHDMTLRTIIDAWLLSLGEEEFTNLLPVLRRGFSSFDRSERRRMLDEIAKLRDAAAAATPVAPPLPGTAGDVWADAKAAPGFAAALPLLLTILGASPDASQGDGP